MKKAKQSCSDELRPEYKRSDLGKMERGKYYQRFKQGIKITVLGPKRKKKVPDTA